MGFLDGASFVGSTVGFLMLGIYPPKKPVRIAFLFGILLAPIAGIVPVAATSPVLIIVGVLMMDGIKKIELSSIDSAIPAVLLIMIMPFTYSIANGIAFGLMFYVLIEIVKGNYKSIHPILYILVVLFLLKYVAL